MLRFSLFPLIAVVMTSAACGVHASDPAPKFHVLDANASRMADDHLAVTIDVKNEDGPATGPLCVRVELVDASMALLEGREICTDQQLGAGASTTFTLQSFGAIHADGGHVLVRTLYGGGQFSGLDSLSVDLPS
ncbi:MAG: hypothetical protein ACRELY_18125 [Polyangiaceae bacterium]